MGDTVKKPLMVGDLVRPIGHEHQLASGCGRYDFAIVVSVDPFVLASESGDMRWSHVSPHNFKTFDTATPGKLNQCMRRLHE